MGKDAIQGWVKASTAATKHDLWDADGCDDTRRLLKDEVGRCLVFDFGVLGLETI